MLVVLDGHLVEIDQPIPVLTNDFYVRRNGNQLFVYADHRKIEAGVRWFAMTKGGKINGATGEFMGKGRYRAVFGENSSEIIISDA